ncbi:pyruvate,water dikinase [Paenibacillus forsythiae]|uniref:Pyruvate,water dikinase n=1 Tax=Paenibacillus forsythiae TaxID=365616 RepID=A0ABU3H2R4_9BACL|nr:PEP/pyruvate-binding domain-containing protein [Paenibacillus forsythiae]MDT3424756.1 pyruvate,water dikinase [Paenibacillus forsythiae]
MTEFGIESGDILEYIKFLDEIDSDSIILAGGKAANLGALLKGGFIVPQGFCVTTKAYWHFVKSNNLEAGINRVLSSVNSSTGYLNTVEAEIRAMFDKGDMPVEIAEEIRQAYHHLNSQVGETCPVAVRSSATAEDLPGMSFAGQQDTFLQVQGIQSVLHYIIQCWSSLWTARAIGYRNRNDIPHESQALAVVVQHMAASKASGVLFTANPLTGKRNEIVIDASFGLGEALVSGKVEPDHYVVDTSIPSIVSIRLGIKGLTIRGKSVGGTEVVMESDASGVQVLNEHQIMELAKISEKIQNYFKNPQDVEWTMDEQGAFYIVQSRPITSLFPIPQIHLKNQINDEKPASRIWFSFASWQGVMDPITPMGQSVLSKFIGDIAGFLGFKEFTSHQHAFYTAAERFYVNITPFMKDKIGRKIILAIMSSLDPTIHHILKRIMAENHFRANPVNSLKLLLKPVLLYRLGQTFAGAARNLLFPKNVHTKLQQTIDSSLSLHEEENNGTPVTNYLLLKRLSAALPKLLFSQLLPGTLSGHIPMQILFKLTAPLPHGLQLSLELTRSLPNNITSEMDSQLWKISSLLKKDQASYERINQLTAAELSSCYLKKTLPHAVQNLISEFLKNYGMRGVAEIDIGRNRWVDDPTPIFLVLKSYLEVKGQSDSSFELYRDGEARATDAQQRLKSVFGKGFVNNLKSRMAAIAAQRLRLLGGLRETPKFAIVCLLNKMRRALLSIGEVWKMEGVLTAAEDIFYLRLEEVGEIIEDSELKKSNIWKRTISERKEKYASETRRKRIPRVLLSDGTAFYDEHPAMDEQHHSFISGNPVSPGIAEGRICVMHHPYDNQLTPGDILVCPATDPAWTPLFLIAGGLIMEVGGMMTHGSVVAREYGVPAIVGVHNATVRLQTGQRVRINGMNGTIEILSAVNDGQKT